jgi:hypothetical protein
MREYTGSRTWTFLPVGLAELHSAVRIKAIARALRAKQRVTNPLGAQADGLCSSGR